MFKMIFQLVGEPAPSTNNKLQRGTLPIAETQSSTPHKSVVELLKSHSDAM